jgi:hypothetical protein
VSDWNHSWTRRIVARAVAWRVIVPDDDSQVSIHTSNLAPGEAALVGLLSDYQSIGPDARPISMAGRTRSP